MRGARVRFEVATALQAAGERALQAIPGVRLLEHERGQPAVLIVPVNAAKIVERMLTSWHASFDATLELPKRLLRPTNHLVIPPEDLPGVKPETVAMLKKYQREGLTYLQKRLGGLAEWDCGLGKTLLGILFERSYPGKTLIVTRSATTTQWASQYRDFCTEDVANRVRVIRGTRGYQAIRSPKAKQIRWIRSTLNPSDLAACQRRLERLQAQRTEAGRLLGVPEKIKTAILILLGGERHRVSEVPGLTDKAIERLLDAELVEVWKESETPDWQPWAVWSELGERIVSYHGPHETPMLSGDEYDRLMEETHAGEEVSEERKRRASILTLAYAGGKPDGIAIRLGLDVEEVEDVLAQRAAEDAASIQEAALDVPDDTEVVIVGWSTLTSRLCSLQNWSPQTIIFDESHRAKNWQRWSCHTSPDGTKSYERKPHVSASAHALATLPTTQRVLLLSATPAPDTTRDLWAQYDLFDPYSMGRFVLWATRYCAGFQGKYGFVSTGTSNVGELQERMRYFRHKVERREVANELPPFFRSMVYLQPRDLNQAKANAGEWRRAKAAGASALLELKLSVAAAMKHTWVANRVKEIVEDKLRVVVITGRRADAERLHRAITKALPDLPCWVAHGGETTPEERIGIKDEFLAVKDKPACLVGTLEAWGEAIDGLQNAHRVMVCMLPWNHGKLIQLEGRFDRLPGLLGAVETVVEYIVALGTVDESVLDVVVAKGEEASAVLQDEGLRQMVEALSGAEQDAAILEGFAMRLLEMDRQRQQRREEFDGKTD